MAGDGSVSGDGRRLAYVFDRRYSPMAIAEFAAGVCQLVWVVDTSEPDVRSLARVIPRFGEVIDVAGLPLEAAADAIAAARPDGIMAETDAMLAWTAQVARALELPFMSAEVAACLSDKHLQRLALRDGGLPVPEFWTIPAADDAAGWEALVAEASFPAVLKPRHGLASRDTVPVASMDEVRAALAELRERYGSQPPMVLEEYLRDRPGAGGDGFAPYCSVESLVCHGRISHLAVSGRTPQAPPFRETGAFIPADLHGHDRTEVLDMARAAIEAVGMELGALHTEIKLTPDGPRIIEVNGRIGGFVPGFATKAIGMELMPLVMRLALGDEIVFETMPDTSGVAYDLRLQAPMGVRRIVSVEGLDGLRDDPYIDEVVLSRGPGQTVDWRSGNNDHVVAVLGKAPDHDELRRILRRVDTEVEIRGE